MIIFNQHYLQIQAKIGVKIVSLKLEIKLLESLPYTFGYRGKLTGFCSVYDMQPCMHFDKHFNFNTFKNKSILSWS